MFQGINQGYHIAPVFTQLLSTNSIRQNALFQGKFYQKPLVKSQGAGFVQVLDIWGSPKTKPRGKWYLENHPEYNVNLRCPTKKNLARYLQLLHGNAWPILPVKTCGDAYSLPSRSNSKLVQTGYPVIPTGEMKALEGVTPTGATVGYCGCVYMLLGFWCPIFHAYLVTLKSLSTVFAHRTPSTAFSMKSV